MARVYSAGGGCGIDISNLRPNGAFVNNAAKYSTGPVSFMDVFSQVTGTISQSGRRGALMISMDVRHPDIEEFIDVKKNTDRVTFANISVRVNDAFMLAVQHDTDYILSWPCGSVTAVERPQDYAYNILYKTEDDRYFKRVRAKKLFEKLVENNWDYAEPGILYWDRVQNFNLLQNSGVKYAGVNPCAEEPLIPYGACLLGSINLSEYVVYPFTDKSYVNLAELIKDVHTAVNALNVVQAEGADNHPLEQQVETAHMWRQIGLGTMGMADMLIKCCCKYGSYESLDLIHIVYSTIAKAAVEESIVWARKYGKFPKCNVEKIIHSDFIKGLELYDYIIENIRAYGLYNSQLLTCAPTGSIATMLGVSTGVEPVYAMHYTRTTKSLEGKDATFEVFAPIAEQWRQQHHGEQLPDYFVESSQINPIERVQMQSILQKSIDAAISSTVNLPKEATKEDVANIYMNAWAYNLKGITIFREGCKRVAILNKEKPADIINNVPKRPKVLKAAYEEVTVKGQRFAVIVGLYNDKPYEIFVTRVEQSLGKHEGKITKLRKKSYLFESDKATIDLSSGISEFEASAAIHTSLELRHGIPLEFIIKASKKANENISSFSSAMCRVLSKYLPKEELEEACPKCGNKLIREGGCIHCSSCEYSKCE